MAVHILKLEQYTEVEHGTNNPHSTAYKKIKYIKKIFFLECKNGSTYETSINVVSHNNRMNDKNNMIISRKKSCFFFICMR